MDSLEWVMLGSMVDPFASWKILLDVLQIAAIWKMLPICILWCIWRERNSWSFEDKECSLEDLRSLFFNILYHCSRSIDFNGLNNVHDFLLTIHFVN